MKPQSAARISKESQVKDEITARALMRLTDKTLNTLVGSGLDFCEVFLSSQIILVLSCEV